MESNSIASLALSSVILVKPESVEPQYIDSDLSVLHKLNVAENIIVGNDNIANMHNSATIGEGLSAMAENTCMFGKNAVAIHPNSFVWNGNPNETYISHGNGTYNINTVDGLNDIYIGNESLQAILERLI